MPTRNQGVGSVIPQTKVDFDRALTIYQNLKSALAIARGDWGSGGERDWSADAEALLKTTADLKLDQRLVLIHTCADLAAQIERSLTLTPIR